MEDYSLTKLRIAVDGEELIAHKFRSGITRMVSRVGFESWKHAVASMFSESAPAKGAARKSICESVKQLWSECFKEFFTFFGFMKSNQWPLEDEPGPIVEIPPEALLRLFDLSPAWQNRYQLGQSEDALFIASAEGLLCFGNGITIPLTLLNEGQRVKVLHHSFPDALEEYPVIESAKR